MTEIEKETQIQYESQVAKLKAYESELEALHNENNTLRRDLEEQLQYSRDLENELADAELQMKKASHSNGTALSRNNDITDPLIRRRLSTLLSANGSIDIAGSSRLVIPPVKVVYHGKVEKKKNLLVI